MDKYPDKLSVLVIVTLTGFLIPFMGSALNVALPQMGSELAMDALSLGWVATAYLLASVILIVPFGRIADIYGRKKFYTYGIIAFTIISFVLSIANSGIVLITFRVVQGVSGAAIHATSLAILTSAFPMGERGRAMGFNVASTYLGFSLGPFLGGLLTQYLGWRSIFLLTVLLGLIITVLTLWKLKGDLAEAKGEKFDVIGSVLYSVMLISITYGFTHLPDILGVWLIVIGGIGFVTFIVWEIKAESPVLQINLFRKNRTFAFSCLATLINYGAVYAIGFLLSLYLQYIKGFSPQDAGIILVSHPVVQAIFSPIAGRISDRIQPRIVATAGMACTTMGLLSFVLLSEETPVLQIVASLVLAGLGFAFFASPNTNAVMSSVEKKFYGVASATQSTMRQLGMIMNMGIVMLLFAFYMGRVQITPEYYEGLLQSMKMAFLISTILCFLGIFASLSRGKVNETDR